MCKSECGAAWELVGCMDECRKAWNDDRLRRNMAPDGSASRKEHNLHSTDWPLRWVRMDGGAAVPNEGEAR
eukprot:6137054-Alexandrium_andersonii.AAC.1